MKHLLIALFALLYLPCPAFGQRLVRILDATSGAPIPFAVAHTADSTVLAAANEQGLLEWRAAWPIYVRALGYETLLLQMPSNDYLVAWLVPKPHQLPEMQIVALQQQFLYEEASQPIGVIGAEVLERESPMILAQAINQVPGLWMQAGQLNTNRLTIRGIGSRSPYSTNKIRVYLGNVPLTNGDGESSLEDLEPLAVGRITAIRGPSGSLYGAGLGGAVLVSPAMGNAGLSLQQQVGSFGLRRSVAQFMHQEGGLQAGITYSSAHTDGFRENSQYSRQQVLGQVRVQGGSATQVEIVWQWIDMHAQIPSSINEATFLESPEKADTRWKNIEGYEAYRKGLIGITLQQQLGGRIFWKNTVFAISKDGGERRPFNSYRDGGLTAGFRSDVQGAAGTRHEWRLGAEYFSDSYKYQLFMPSGLDLGALIGNTQDQKRMANLFAQWNWQASKRLQLTAGFNASKTDYWLLDYMQGGHKTLREMPLQYSPSLSALWKAGNKGNIFASVGRGFSPPSISQTLANAGIRPETGWGADVGYRRQLLKERLFVEATLYTIQVSNLLTLQRLPDDTFTERNTGNTSHSGMEGQYEWALLKKGDWQLQSWGNLALNLFVFKAFEENGQSYAGNRLTGTPTHTANIGLSCSWKGLSCSAAWQSVGSMPLDDANTKFAEGYALWQGRMGYRKQVGKRWEARASALWQNIGNARYSAMVLVNAPSLGGSAPRYYYPGAPRNWQLEVGLAYRMAINSTNL